LTNIYFEQITEHMVFLQLEQIFMLLELNEYATTRIMVMNLMPMVWLILQYSVDAMCTI